MLNTRRADFCVMVWNTAKTLGQSPTSIADAIMKEIFPGTCEEAAREGADRMLRRGVIEEISRVLKGSFVYEQLDFSKVSEQFRPLVRALKSRSYTAPSVGELIPIETLIQNPTLLDEARRFMRQKGHECLEEADRLDKLYFAVTAP